MSLTTIYAGGNYSTGWSHRLTDSEKSAGARIKPTRIVRLLN
jgi:hypothetical protein